MSLLNVAIIHDSPLAPITLRWDALLNRLLVVERTLGWRCLWESALSAEVATVELEIIREYRSVLAWVPEGDEEASNKRALLNDLCAYERAFANIARALAAWPQMPASQPDPKLLNVIARSH